MEPATGGSGRAWWRWIAISVLLIVVVAVVWHWRASEDNKTVDVERRVQEALSETRREERRSQVNSPVMDLFDGLKSRLFPRTRSSREPREKLEALGVDPHLGSTHPNLAPRLGASAQGVPPL